MSLKESLTEIVQKLNETAELLVSTGIKDHTMNQASLKKLTSRTLEMLRLVTTNEPLFLHQQASSESAISNFKLNIKILAIEQKADKTLLNKAKTDDEKSALQSILKRRSFEITTLHQKISLSNHAYK